ncbi:nuclear transcription factor Y subunit B-10-like [Aristolochia californica]|uniref:nuclear transcription factor Y subunit B-10-like n=1 Tax=Aristolochia californica TaxID=171875 RepID=UPI0035D783F2
MVGGGSGEGGSGKKKEEKGSAGKDAKLRTTGSGEGSSSRSANDDLISLNIVSDIAGGGSNAGRGVRSRSRSRSKTKVLLRDCRDAFIRDVKSKAKKIRKREKMRSLSTEHIIAALREMGLDKYVNDGKNFSDEVCKDKKKKGDSEGGDGKDGDGDGGAMDMA